MQTSAMDCMELLGYKEDESGYYDQPIEDFLRKTQIVSLVDLQDVASTLYKNFGQLFPDKQLEDLAPVITGIRLLMHFIYEKCEFNALLQQPNHNMSQAWAMFMRNIEDHRHRFARFQMTYSKDELDQLSMECDDDDYSKSQTASRRTKGSRRKSIKKGKPSSDESTINSQCTETKVKTPVKSALKTVF
jgi:hypothetical protein